jgi:hypothetical protein
MAIVMSGNQEVRNCTDPNSRPTPTPLPSKGIPEENPVSSANGNNDDDNGLYKKRARVSDDETNGIHVRVKKRKTDPKKPKKFQPWNQRKQTEQKEKSPARSWMITDHNVDNHEERYSKLAAEARYVIYSIEESPQTGNKHIQGYVEFGHPVRWAKVKSLIGEKSSYVAKRFSAREDCREYCRKPETHIEGPYEHGEWEAGGQGCRTDMKAMMETIQAGLEEIDVWDAVPEQMAKYPRAYERYRMLWEKDQLLLPFPFTLPNGQIVEAPKASEKKRHWYILAPSNSGKTEWVEKTFEGKAVYSPIRNKERRSIWDIFEDQSVVLFDDWYPDMTDLVQCSTTFRRERVPVPGFTRYQQKCWKKDHCRVMIILKFDLPPYFYDSEKREAFINRFNFITYDEQTKSYMPLNIEEELQRWERQQAYEKEQKKLERKKARAASAALMRELLESVVVNGTKGS